MKKGGKVVIENFKMAISSRHTFNLVLHINHCGSKKECMGQWYPNVYEDYFTLVYLFKGKGILTMGKEIFFIEQDQGFLIPPNTQVSFYCGEKCDLGWVCLFGFLVEFYFQRTGLSSSNPVYTDNEQKDIGNQFYNIFQDSKRQHNRYCRITASLYMIMGTLLDMYDSHAFKSNNREAIDTYIEKAIQYIDMNYSETISVKDIADYVGIDRKYLHSIFRKILDIGPQQYLIIYRVNKACFFLRQKEMTIGEIAKSVGYDNQHTFSKVFKRVVGISAKEYRDHPIFVNYKYLKWEEQLHYKKNQL